MNYIYHITDQETWKNYSQYNEISHDSLNTEGFIHCCDYDQIQTVANRFFKNINDLYVLEINPTLLDSKVLYELSDTENYPHIYGKIQTQAITSKLYFSRISKNKIELIKK